MWYYLIVVSVLHQELRYLFRYYQYAKMSSFSFKTNDITAHPSICQLNF